MKQGDDGNGCCDSYYCEGDCGDNGDGVVVRGNEDSEQRRRRSRRLLPRTRNGNNNGNNNINNDRQRRRLSGVPNPPPVVGTAAAAATASVAALKKNSGGGRRLPFSLLLLLLSSFAAFGTFLAERYHRLAGNNRTDITIGGAMKITAMKDFVRPSVEQRRKRRQRLQRQGEGNNSGSQQQKSASSTSTSAPDFVSLEPSPRSRQRLDRLLSRHPDECRDKLPWLEVLADAYYYDNDHDHDDDYDYDYETNGEIRQTRGTDDGDDFLTADLCRRLPSRRQVDDLYGGNNGGNNGNGGPVVLGLETCEAYRNKLKEPAPQDEKRATTSGRFRGRKPRRPVPVRTPPLRGVGGEEEISPTPPRKPMPKLAGLWNTGSTALSKLFLRNFEGYNGTWNVQRATVPWGKHTVLKYRYDNTWPPSNRDSKDHVLPVVVVRDPFRWMTSMVRMHARASASLRYMIIELIYLLRKNLIFPLILYCCVARTAVPSPVRGRVEEGAERPVSESNTDRTGTA